MESLYNLYLYLTSSPIAVSLIITPLLSGLSFLLIKFLPSKIKDFICSFFSIKVEIYQTTDRASFDVGEYILRKYSFWSPFTTFILRKPDFDNTSTLYAGLNVNFYGIVDGIFTKVNRYNDILDKYNHSFILSFQFFTKDKKKISELFNRVTNEYRTKNLDNKLYLYLPAAYSGWDLHIRDGVYTTPRTNSQIDAFKKIVDAIHNPKMSKLGVLLYGSPGSGKSKLVEMIALAVNYRIYYFSLSSQTNESFLHLFSDMITPAIILLEDIDCVSVSHDRNDKDTNFNNTKVDLSMLLNTLDGVLTRPEQVVIATTNYKDKLDAALIRKGRFDLSLELTDITKHDIAAYIAQEYEVDVSIVLRTMDQYDKDWKCSIAALSAICRTANTYTDVVTELANTL